MKPKPPKEKEPMLKSTILRIRPELLRRAKKAAIDRDITLQQLLTDALEAFLKKAPKEVDR